MDASISPASLIAARTARSAPLVIDVRRRQAYSEATDTIAGALRRDPDRLPEWITELPRHAAVVVYCVHGHQVSQSAAQAMRAQGWNARFLEHGIEGWRDAGGALQIKPAGSATVWVTRERPKIDRIACPWLITRFIDRNATFLYVPAAEIQAVAAARSALAYDADGAAFGHVGDRCSFDAFAAAYHLDGDPALSRLGTIVRGADTGHLEAAPESPGLLTISAGLSRLHTDDHAMLRQGMPIYDALYRACQGDTRGPNTWQLHIDD